MGTVGVIMTIMVILIYLWQIGATTTFCIATMVMEPLLKSLQEISLLMVHILKAVVGAIMTTMATWIYL